MNFSEAIDKVRQLSREPNNYEKLQLYSLYKQVLFGDNTTPAPGYFDFENKAKWKAWMALKGKSSAD